MTKNYSIKQRRLFTSLLMCLCSTTLIYATVEKTVNVETTGTLSSLLTTDDKTSVTNLTVTGSLNADDLATINSMSAISTLDISGATVTDNTIPDYTFYYQQTLSSVILPASITTIGGDAFGESALESIQLPADLTTLGTYVFENCPNLKAIDMRTCTKLLIISEGTFSIGTTSTLKSVQFPPNLTIIGQAAFAGCALENIAIPSSVTIETNAFSLNAKLKDVHIKLSNSPVSSYPSNVFYLMGTDNGTGKVSFIVDVVNPPALVGTFDQKTASTVIPQSTLYVPASSVDAYKASANGNYFGWKDFGTIIGRPMVKYSINGTITDSSYVFSDSLLIAPTDPVKDGYTFAGWYTDAAFTTAWNFTASYVTADTTLFARFTKKNPTGITIEKSVSLSVYPNPVSDILTISGFEGNASLIVTDLSGKTVLNREISNNSAVSVSFLAKGVYIARIKNNVIKIVKK